MTKAPTQSRHFQPLLTHRSSLPPPTGIGLGFPFRLDRPTLGSPPSALPNPPSSHSHSPLSCMHFSPSSPSTPSSASASPVHPLRRTTHAERVCAERAMEVECRAWCEWVVGQPQQAEAGTWVCNCPMLTHFILGHKMHSSSSLSFPHSFPRSFPESMTSPTPADTDLEAHSDADMKRSHGMEMEG